MSNNNAVNAAKMIALMVLRNQGWGESRIRRFSEQFNKLADDVALGRESLSEFADTIYDETGLTLSDIQVNEHKKKKVNPVLEKGVVPKMSDKYANAFLEAAKSNHYVVGSGVSTTYQASPYIPVTKEGRELDKQFVKVRAIYQPAKEHEHTVRDEYRQFIGKIFTFQYTHIMGDDEMFPGVWALMPLPKYNDGEFIASWVPEFDIAIISVISTIKGDVI